MAKLLTMGEIYPQSLAIWKLVRNFRERRAGYAFPPILYYWKKDLDI
jgi:hypothetical protein